MTDFIKQLAVEFIESNWHSFLSFCKEKGMSEEEIEQDFDKLQKEAYN